jgi:hypothetical protein
MVLKYNSSYRQAIIADRISSVRRAVRAGCVGLRAGRGAAIVRLLASRGELILGALPGLHRGCDRQSFL